MGTLGLRLSRRDLEQVLLSVCGAGNQGAGGRHLVLPECGSGTVGSSPQVLMAVAPGCGGTGVPHWPRACSGLEK